MKKKVLVLEDESSIRSFVVLNLQRSGYEVIEASTGSEALDELQKNSDISIAILDVMLPDMNGLDICRHIRGLGLTIGIIMLTAMVQENDRVTGLMTGADDYITKPFSVIELVARVDALYRRLLGNNSVNETLSSGPFELDLKSRELRKFGKKIELTQVEYQIIKMFIENKGRALDREKILEQIWGQNYLGDLKIVDVNIRRLRLKIEDDAALPRYITTIWGYGYKWEG